MCDCLQLGVVARDGGAVRLYTSPLSFHCSSIYEGRWKEGTLASPVPTTVSESGASLHLM